MDFLSLAIQRRSVRSYLPRPVEDERLVPILLSALRAPSAVNFQPWRILIVKSPEGKERLQACYDRGWFKTAPLYLIVCVDEAAAWTRKSDGKNHADIDGAIVAEHLALAAADQGLGTCWVCNFDPDLLADYIKDYVNETTRAVAILPLGYPDNSTGGQKTSERKPLDELFLTI